MQCDISSGILQSRGTQWVTKTSQSFWAMVSWRQVNKTPGTILGVLHFFPYYFPNNSTRYIPISHTSQLIFRIEVTRPSVNQDWNSLTLNFVFFHTLVQEDKVPLKSELHRDLAPPQTCHFPTDNSQMSKDC